MPPALSLYFGTYRLDGPDGPLWHHAELVALPPKALAVLWLLSRQAGQVVSKATLLDMVWAETVVSEGTLTNCLSLLRQALGEDARQPRYIATVHRLGYRFVAPVTQEERTSSLAPPPAPHALVAPPPASPPLIVGRAAELARLHACFAQARQGARQTVFVVGEAGMGKTTLVDAFVAEVAAAQTAWIGWGQCIDHSGAGEAYLPLLDALGRLGRGRAGAQLGACLRQYAPAWLRPLAALGGEEAPVAGWPSGPGVTPQRMLRELVEALEAFTAAHPLLLVLEDLHWSDASTVEALTLLARRRDAARLLVLGTYRPVELILRQHPLKAAKQELQLHGHCADVPVGYLPVAAVQAYLAQRGRAAATAERAAWVHQRTEGHPLFMVHVVEELARRGWQTAPPAPAAAGGGAAVEVPVGLRPLIELQLEQLDAEAQQVLEVASVVGAEFTEASVAAGLPLPLEAIAARCEGLAQRGQFIEDRGLAAWPDGTVSGRYGFRHALYQEVLYGRIGSGRRMRCHRAIGARLEAGYGAQVAQIAATLAMHFERGCDPARAVRYRQQAAEQALQRYAYREVVEHLRTALELLQSLPETPEHAQHELALQMALGSAAMAAHGETAPTVEQAYARACALCQQVGAISQFCAALVGLGTWYATAGQLQKARGLLEQALHYGQEACDSADHARAAVMLGSVTFLSGDFLTARAHLEEGQRLYTPQRQRFHALASPAFGLARLAGVLWHLGYPDQARRRSDEALCLARTVAHPWEVLVTLIFAASVHQHCREVSQTRALAEEALTLAHEQGFGLRFAQAQLQHGWALVLQGHGADGMAQLQQGIAAYRAQATVEAVARYATLEAEAYAHLGEPGTGLQRLTAVMADLTPDADRYNQAELWRLRGDLLLQDAAWGPEVRHSPQLEAAETFFRQALALTHRQHAKTLKLRAALSLSRLLQQQDKRQEAYDLLAPIYRWFTEGFDTADLQGAKTLLEALA